MMAGSPSLPPHAASELYEARDTVEQEVGADLVEGPRVAAALECGEGGN